MERGASFMFLYSNQGVLVGESNSGRSPGQMQSYWTYNLTRSPCQTTSPFPAITAPSLLLLRFSPHTFVSPSRRADLPGSFVDARPLSPGDSLIAPTTLRSPFFFECSGVQVTKPWEATLPVGGRDHKVLVELFFVGLGGGDHVVGPPGVHVTSRCGSLTWGANA